MSRGVIAGAVLVLLIVVGAIFVLIAKLTGDSTGDQEGTWGAFPTVVTISSPATPTTQAGTR